MKANISEENKSKLNCFSEKCKSAAAKAKADEERKLWLENTQNFSISFERTLEQEKERFENYYLKSVKEIIETENIEISDKVLANAIKNGLLIKYPELKTRLR